MLPILYLEGHEAFPTLTLLPEASAYGLPLGLGACGWKAGWDEALDGGPHRIMVVESSEFVDLRVCRTEWCRLFVVALPTGETWVAPEWGFCILSLIYLLERKKSEGKRVLKFQRIWREEWMRGGGFRCPVSWVIGKEEKTIRDLETDRQTSGGEGRGERGRALASTFKTPGLTLIR